jgi:hypothetical protein
MVLFGALLLAGWWLPRSPAVARDASSRPGLLSAMTQVGPLRLSLSFSALVMMGFGMSTVNIGFLLAIIVFVVVMSVQKSRKSAGSKAE